MNKLLIILFIIQLSNQLVNGNQKFEIFRSANIQLNEESHKNSDLSAFHLDKLNVKADLENNETTGENVEEAETHPIDFKKINLANNRIQARRNQLVNRDLMQNDGSSNDDIKIPKSDIKSRKYQSQLRMMRSKSNIAYATKKESNTFNQLYKNQLFNYDYYCQPKNYLAECLRKKLSTKFLLRFRIKNNKKDLNYVINDLSKLNLELDYLAKSNKTSISINQATTKNLINSLDKLFYDYDFLSNLLSSCIISFESNCEQTILNRA